MIVEREKDLVLVRMEDITRIKPNLGGENGEIHPATFSFYNGGWIKTITGLDETKVDFYSIQGEFIGRSGKFVKIGSLILVRDISGSRKKPNTMNYVCKVLGQNDLQTLFWSESAPDLFDTIKTELKRIDFEENGYKTNILSTSLSENEKKKIFKLFEKDLGGNTVEPAYKFQKLIWKEKTYINPYEPKIENKDFIELETDLTDKKTFWEKYQKAGKDNKFKNWLDNESRYRLSKREGKNWFLIAKFKFSEFKDEPSEQTPKKISKEEKFTENVISTMFKGLSSAIKVGKKTFPVTDISINDFMGGVYYFSRIFKDLGEFKEIKPFIIQILSKYKEQTNIIMKTQNEIQNWTMLPLSVESEQPIKSANLYLLKEEYVKKINQFLQNQPQKRAKVDEFSSIIPDLKNNLEFLESCLNDLPVYYSQGNSELKIKDYGIVLLK